MNRVLLTGMSASGKSSLVRGLAGRGYKAIDTDWDPEWEEPPHPPRGGPGWIWREDRIETLLDTEDADILFVGACVEDQATFYPRFDHIVLLSAPVELTVERLATRTANPYGRRAAEVEEVLRFKRTVEPLLRAGATAEIDTSQPLEEVMDAVLRLVGAGSR